jgi:hypothetical protein
MSAFQTFIFVYKSGYAESLKHEIVHNIDNCTSSDPLEIVRISDLMSLVTITIDNFICFGPETRVSSQFQKKIKSIYFWCFFQLFQNRFGLIHKLFHVCLVLLTLICIFWLNLRAFPWIYEFLINHHFHLFPSEIQLSLE